VKLRPSDARVHLIYADILSGLDGQEAEAEAAYHKALTLDPHAVDALIGLANALDTQGRLPEAEALYRRALEVTPENWEAHYHYAILLADAERDREAEQEHRRAVALHDGAAPRFGYARFLAQRARWGEARALYHEGLELSPGDAEAWLELAAVLVALDEREPARAAFVQAISLEEENVTALHRYGEALATWGELEAAEERLRAALEARPGYVLARLALAELLARMEREKDALAEFVRCSDLEPDDAALTLALGAALARFGRRDDALREVRHALRLDPAVPGGAALLAELMGIHPAYPMHPPAQGTGAAGGDLVGLGVAGGPASALTAGSSAHADRSDGAEQALVATGRAPAPLATQQRAAQELQAREHAGGPAGARRVTVIALVAPHTASQPHPAFSPTAAPAGTADSDQRGKRAKRGFFARLFRRGR
jgi:Flp pilus assembly protein TadD